MSASVVPAVRRQRAPTITIDTSPVEAPTGVYFDNPGSEAVEATTYELPRQSSGVVTDRGTGSPDLAPDNPFASTPSQLSKMFNPKSLPAFWKLGGLAGTEKGLRTDCHSGLSIDETSLSKSASFDGPSGRPCGGRLNEAPVPSPDSEARQYCYSGRDNASADSETLDEDWNMIVERLDPVTMRRQENLVAEGSQGDLCATHRPGR
ncbi:hypothetical protein B0T18DRAFT_205747 [Schizothecium vesticola]|uniref:Uncharacterized protein n=1 Tax=Schizothecium vesticola TaxID=314040 RepID=A0AA40EJ37_9PEZI|nr:hypothetical protein B0T18DRAFT_205747 [Schizothecium vesticola]